MAPSRTAMRDSNNRRSPANELDSLGETMGVMGGMLNSCRMITATHLGGKSNSHINKSVFNDMIVLASFYPLLDSRIDSRSLFENPGFREGRENRPQLRCGIASQTQHRAIKRRGQSQSGLSPR
jgi:hypothetical protein